MSYSLDDPVIYFDGNGEARNRKVSNENYVDPDKAESESDSSVRIRKISDEIRARMAAAAGKVGRSNWNYNISIWLRRRN